MTLTDAKLYAILDFGYLSAESMPGAAKSLIAGGAQIIQLRAKNVPLDIVRATSLEILPIAKSAKIPFILNDYPHLAEELGTDGVHIGQSDGSIQDTRKIVGPDQWIGRSTHSLSQARQALADGADYIGFGPLFPTPTKAGRPAIGIQEVSRMQTEVGQQIPAFCIGGIKPDNIAEVLNAGAKRVVVVSHLLSASDISSATKAMRALLPD